MKLVVFTHSLRSCWNHGNAHFLRGVLRDQLAAAARQRAARHEAARMAAAYGAAYKSLAARTGAAA